jgi:hypothetical protein
MTTQERPQMTRTGRPSGLRWRHADDRNPKSAPAAESAHQLMVLSRHQTSEGTLTYTRCRCGELQIWLTHPGRGPAPPSSPRSQGRNDRPHNPGTRHQAGPCVDQAPKPKERPTHGPTNHSGHHRR